MRPDAGEDLLVRGEAIGLVLRIDALAVERHVEHATVSALEASGDSELFLDGGLQTGGLWVVVSFGAVGDLDVHACTPFPAPRASLDDSRDGGVARASESPRAVGARGDSGARDWVVALREPRHGSTRMEWSFASRTYRQCRLRRSRCGLAGGGHRVRGREGYPARELDGLLQDTQGIWSLTDGSRVDWFRDPDGLTLTQRGEGPWRPSA